MRERAASAQFSDSGQDTKAKLLNRLKKMTPSEVAKKSAECVTKLLNLCFKSNSIKDRP